ncbi:BamA/TamA family outer membrane protein [Mucilaginibacter myungsuensis]|uniref:BamA/TamA family outer membrane protein n=1 Tax=Mucilaginibacter myungsuensis TaxID=649104 RepID=A0A929L0Z3_9SPHI|nr:BamA/TamA family outer membrane protein [Mucilaginibacter myungsuensis]MBE9663578.1 BamA/TamA family outer membrane protein [Mucilaginibacter myungsuensis]MDN3599098.1 BamA/TamA family outer membrane protein [Mucilaginibacter myungsuensis]
MKKLLFVAITCFCKPVLVKAQEVIRTNRQIDTVGKADLLDVASLLFEMKPKPVEEQKGKSVYFSVLPGASSVPGGGTALITTTAAGFYLGPRSSTYISNVTFTPYLNFSGRFGLPLRSTLWTRDNSWVIQGDTRFLVYPQYTWGLGGRQTEENRILLDYKYIRFHQRALKRVTDFFFAGIGYDLDYHIDIQNERTDKISSFTGYRYGAANDQHSFSSGVTANFLYDTRNNALNPLPGCYINAIYRYNSKMLGSDDSWQSLYFDFRKYINLSKERRKKQLALWGYYWTSIDSGTPYLDLPSIGWDPYNASGRGMPQNRYRGHGLLYFEAEYRRDLLDNGLFGYVLFANASSVTEAANRNFRYINPAVGAGLRIKFNKRSDTNIAIDYGVSKSFKTLMIGLGEAF